MKNAWFRRQHLQRAGVVSALVGTALVALNHGDLLLAWYGGEPLPDALAWKIPLVYAVPFLVSWGSSIAAARDGRRL
jgi:hypothetical protein